MHVSKHVYIYLAQKILKLTINSKKKKVWMRYGYGTHTARYIHVKCEPLAL